MSWTPEQKAAQSAKMKAYWAAKKAEAGEQVPASLPAIEPAPITSSIVQPPAPVLEPQLSDKTLNKVTLVEIDEDAELEAAYKDIVSRKGFSANLARYQMQELLEDSVTVQMAFKSYLRKLQAGNPLILKDHMDRVLGKATQRVELTADVTSKNLLTAMTPEQVLKLARRESFAPPPAPVPQPALEAPAPQKTIEVSPTGEVTHVEQKPEPEASPVPAPSFGKWKTGS